VVVPTSSGHSALYGQCSRRFDMPLLDLQAMSTSKLDSAPHSAMSLSCVPESNVSAFMCDDDPDSSNVSVVLCSY